MMPRRWTAIEYATIAAARSAGEPWETIGVRFGVSGEKARSAYRSRRLDSTPQVRDQAPPTTRTGASVSQPRPAVTDTPPPASPAIIMGRVRRAVPVVGTNAPGRYRMAHMTDIHFGSKHCDAKALLEFLDIAKQHDVHAVVCTGDTLDGISSKFIHEQRETGFEGQATEAVEVITAAKLAVPIVAITGNHDGYFNDIVGLDAGRALAERMHAAGVDWRSAGSCYGRAIIHGAKTELYHPHGSGNTRAAVKRVLAAKARTYAPEDRPHFLFGGHFHKFAIEHLFPEDVVVIGGGTFQKRESDFGIRMLNPWDVGGWIVSWTVRLDGSISERGADFYCVRPEAKGWAA
jgi:predicted phosphodiesterase